MIKPKKHNWVLADKEIAGIYKCENCPMVKIKSPGIKTIFSRGGDIDNSKTRNNCFVLSKS